MLCFTSNVDSIQEQTLCALNFLRGQFLSLLLYDINKHTLAICSTKVLGFFSLPAYCKADFFFPVNLQNMNYYKSSLLPFKYLTLYSEELCIPTAFLRLLISFFFKFRYLFIYLFI